MNGACYCGSENTRRYPAGDRCSTHTPAALAGQPEPDTARYCAPYRCYCGQNTCPSSGSYTRPLDAITANITDFRAVASGKRRSSPAEYRNAKANISSEGEAR